MRSRRNSIYASHIQAAYRIPRGQYNARIVLVYEREYKTRLLLSFLLLTRDTEILFTEVFVTRSYFLREESIKMYIMIIVT